METALKELSSLEEKETVDYYLGYRIESIAGWFLAMPQGWNGSVLEAPSLPQLRTKIWSSWYQLAS